LSRRHPSSPPAAARTTSGRLTLPPRPASVKEIVKLFETALTPRTRIIVFSHITWETGLVLPVKEICQLARKHGILTHIDGAHGLGQIPVDLHNLGCDSETASRATIGPSWTGFSFRGEQGPGEVIAEHGNEEPDADKHRAPVADDGLQYAR